MLVEIGLLPKSRSARFHIIFHSTIASLPCATFLFRNLLSSPLAKRSGPKSLRAESARAVTGRRWGENCIAGWSSGGPSRSFLGPKLAQKSDLLRFTYITHLFGLSWTRLNAIIMIVSYLKVWLGIALLPSARGLYLARHLSTLYQNCLCVFVR